MDNRLFYPATERNKDAILNVLKSYLPPQGNVLEIASGSGEHIVHFAQFFPDIIWHPSDLEVDCLKSIESWVKHLSLTNVETPVQLDTTQEDWPKGQLDALLCINMVHISPWEASVGLMEKAGQYIKAGGILYLYGPYRRHGAHTAASNEAFEGWLLEKDPRFGVRHMEDVEKEALKNGLELQDVIDMPANNFSLVFKRV